MIDSSSTELSRAIGAIPSGVKKEEVTRIIEKEREEITKIIEKANKTLPAPLKKEEVSQLIEKSLKSLPASLKKEEVIQLIDKATSNFLKTIKCKPHSLKVLIANNLHISSGDFQLGGQGERLRAARQD